MLEMRPNCETCDRGLSPGSLGAMICSFECTFCRKCAESIHVGKCPSCGSDLVRRPVRPAGLLARYPA